MSAPEDDFGDAAGYVDAETGEVTTAPRAPRVRTLDQIVQRANGGEYRDVMPKMLEQFFAHLFHHATDHDRIAKGSFTVKFAVVVDRYGETEIGIQPAVKLPDPPMADGLARAFMHADGTLVTHQQHEMPIFRNPKKREQKLRDTGAAREDRS